MDREHWRIIVHGMLRAGFGVQDISVRLIAMKLPWFSESVIRAEIRDLRASGKLTEVLALHRRQREVLRPIPSHQDHQDS
jgi:hypothetical protein